MVEGAHNLRSAPIPNVVQLRISIDKLNLIKNYSGYRFLRY